jgi:gliding motility-associated-like protein
MQSSTFNQLFRQYKAMRSAFFFLLTIFAINQVHALSFSTVLHVHKSYCDTINGSARVIPDPRGRYEYRWSTGSLSDSSFGLAPGAYYVTVTHLDSLSGARLDSLIDTVNISFQSVRIFITASNNPSCGINNGNILTAATGGSGSYTFHYYRFGIDLHFGTNLYPGHYVMSVEDNVTGCNSDSATIDLTDNGSYVGLVDSIKVTERCFRDSTGSIRISVAGGRPPYHYLWSTGDTTTMITHLTLGAYTLSLTDSLCPLAAHIYHIVLGGPSAPLHDSLICIADTCLRGLGSVKALSTGGTMPYVYHWSASATLGDTNTLLTAGRYGVRVVDAHGCDDSLSFGIANAGGPSAHVVKVDSACEFGPLGAAIIAVTSNDGPHHFSWSQDTSLNSNKAVALRPGLYSVTVSNNKACDTVLHLMIPAYYSPGLQLEKDSSILLGQEVGLTASGSTLYDSTFWWPAFHLASVNLEATVKPTVNTSYHVLVFYQNGCWLADSVLIQVRDVPAMYVIPNIFTPNEDGINDRFYVNFNEGVKDVELHIFDRWGNKVFDSFYKDFRWDGTLQNRGLALEEGVYSYFLLIKAFDTEKIITESGSITLLR